MSDLSEKLKASKAEICDLKDDANKLLRRAWYLQGKLDALSESIKADREAVEGEHRAASSS